MEQDVDKKTENETAETPKTPEIPAPLVWERPRLERLGSLRNLVGKSGPLPEIPGPNPTRT